MRSRGTMSRGLLLGLAMCSQMVCAVAQGAAAFSREGLEPLSFVGRKCTGFYRTPSWKCEPITIPGYLRRAPDTNALVMISHGSQGLDKRHSDYAKQLADNGINSVVIGHWEARGLGQIQFDYDKARREGGDSPNQVLDVYGDALGLAHHARPLPDAARDGGVAAGVRFRHGERRDRGRDLSGRLPRHALARDRHGAAHGGGSRELASFPARVAPQARALARAAALGERLAVRLACEREGHQRE